MLNELPGILYNWQSCLLLLYRETWTLIELLQMDNWIYFNMIMLPCIIPQVIPLLMTVPQGAIRFFVFCCLLFPWPKEEIFPWKFYLNKCGNSFIEALPLRWCAVVSAALGFLSFPVLSPFTRLLFLNAYGQFTMSCVGKQWQTRQTQAPPLMETRSMYLLQVINSRYYVGGLTWIVFC